jgi:hypothetical protein
MKVKHKQSEEQQGSRMAQGRDVIKLACTLDSFTRCMQTNGVASLDEATSCSFTTSMQTNEVA